MVKYNVYRDSEKIASGITDTAYVDNDVQPSTTYSYQVSAENEHGESDLTDVVTVNTEPTVTTDTETVTENVVPYTTTNVETDDLPEGETEVQTEGVDGYDTVTYLITLHDGVEVNREEQTRETTEPIQEVIRVGTWVEE